MRLQDKVALVTGASQGIGEAIAKRYAREGAKVAVNYNRSTDKAGAVVAAIRAGGGAAEAFQADCSQVPAINDLVARVRDTYGPIDILVNNAGLFHTVSIEDTTEEIWDAQLDLNLKGAFFLTKAVVPDMKARGGGKIINLASIFGTGAGPNCPAYCASKGGVVNLTKALATELSKGQDQRQQPRPGQHRHTAQRSPPGPTPNTSNSCRRSPPAASPSSTRKTSPAPPSTSPRTTPPWSTASPSSSTPAGPPGSQRNRSRHARTRQLLPRPAPCPASALPRKCPAPQEQRRPAPVREMGPRASQGRHRLPALRDRLRPRRPQ